MSYADHYWSWNLWFNRIVLDDVDRPSMFDRILESNGIEREEMNLIEHAFQNIRKIYSAVKFHYITWLKIVLFEIWWEWKTKENKSTEIQTKNDKTMRCGCDVCRLFTCYYLFSLLVSFIFVPFSYVSISLMNVF